MNDIEFIPSANYGPIKKEVKVWSRVSLLKREADTFPN